MNLNNLPDWIIKTKNNYNKIIQIYKKNNFLSFINLNNLFLLFFGRKKYENDNNINFNNFKSLNSSNLEDIQDSIQSIVLDHQSISRKHAMIIFDSNDNSYLIDLNSSHGTFVNNQKIDPNTPVKLNINDVIQFGQSSRTYIYSEKSERPPVPEFNDSKEQSIEIKESNTIELENYPILEDGNPTIVLETTSSEKPRNLTKEEERREREKEIARYALEMSSTVPIFKSTKNTLTKEEALIAAKRNINLDGATFEDYNYEEIDDDNDDRDNEDDENENEDEDENDNEDDSDNNEGNYEQKKEIKNSQKSQEILMDDLETIAFSRKIPLSHQVDLAPHGKVCTSISFEPNGNRIVTGSLDYNIKVYDFGGMDKRHLAFKSVEVEDGHSITSISHSPSGDKFIVCTTSCQPKIFDREGQLLITFCRGDMYLRDLSNTKGHTMETTGCQWHPTDKNFILTSGLDGALRIWDLRGEALFGNLINKHVLKIKPKSGQNTSRLGATSCCYSRDGTKAIGGASDGTIHIWFTHSHYNKADIIIDNPFQNNSFFVMSVVESPIQEGLLGVRYENGLIVLWSYETKKKEVKRLKTFNEANNVYQMSNLEFSPDGTILCCGTSLKSLDSSSTDKGMLYFYDIKDLQTNHSVTTSPFLGIALSVGCSAVCIKWQPKTNQIFCSTSDGKTRVFFDPRLSNKGALLTASKIPKREKDPSDYSSGVGTIYLPDALPMYREDKPSDMRKKRADVRRDPVRSKIPEKPAGFNKTAENTSFFFTKYLMEGREMNTSHKEDPREALLKMNDLASNNPIYFGSAYSQTQPKVILYEDTFENEIERLTKKQKTDL